MLTRVQFSEGLPPKICEGGKNVQNFSQFLTTFDFDCEYLRNGSSYRKSLETTVINYNHFHVGPKKSGELWSTNNRVKVAHIDQPKWTFSGDYISAIRGCCPLKFSHALEIDTGYLAHTRTSTGSPPPKKN